MAATINLREWNGAVLSPTKTIKTTGTILPRANDSPAVDSLSPVPIPKSGLSRSYEKWLRFAIGSTGPAGNISNLAFFTDGANLFGLGITLLAGADDTYALPVITASPVAVTDIVTYVAGNVLSLGAGPFTGANADIGLFCVLQAVVAPTAAEGLSGAVIPSFVYDET